MAYTAYTSPGVSVTETVTQSLAPLTDNPAVIAIVGPAQGYQVATETIVLTGTTPYTFKYTGLNTAEISVSDLTTGVFGGSAVNAGAYVITAGTSPTGNVGDTPYEIASFGTATAPSLATGSGSLTGTYQYEVTFLNASGETGPGTASSTITITSQGVSLSAIALGPTGTTGRNIYRQKITGGVSTGYTLVQTLNNNTATTLTDNTSDGTAATGASPPQGINSGDTVQVTYQYTNSAYWQPQSFSSLQGITNTYGSAFTSTGTINSSLTFGAFIALVNGATQIICVPSASAGTTAVETALLTLQSEPEVRFVLCTVGTPACQQAVVSHCQSMNAQSLFRQGIIGIDGSATAVTIATQRALAQSINDQSIQCINSTSFQYQNPVSLAIYNVGGQYAACGVAGMWAARDVQFPLTRQTLAGFQGIVDTRSLSDQGLDSAAGLFVISEGGSYAPSGILTVRQSVTTNIGNVNNREGSVVRAKFDMAHRLSDALNSSVVGNVFPAGQATAVVASNVVGVLQQMVLQSAIQGFTTPQATVDPNSPTTVDVIFSYLPSYPVNNVIINFSVNTTDGSLNVTSQ